MSDIVKRLRFAWEAMGEMANAERAEAADEIDRLRAGRDAAKREGRTPMPSLPERLRKEAQEIRESWSDMEPCDSFPHYRAHDMAQAELFDAAAAEIERLCAVIGQGNEEP